MRVTTTPITQPERHPAVDKVLEMPQRSLLLVIRPYAGSNVAPMILDAILRTGSGGWRSIMQEPGRTSSYTYLNEATVQNLVGDYVAQGSRFELVEVAR